MTSKKRHKSPKRTEPANGPVCPSCGLATLFESRFCHSCGATLDGGPGGSKWYARRLASVGMVATLVIVAVIAGTLFFKHDGAPSSSPLPILTPEFNTPSMTSLDSPPDLSEMIAREAADRLFNRIMMASEQRKPAGAPSSSPLPILTPEFNTPFMTSQDSPPDLSQMTAREAADRLFNRIMTASEQGKPAEVEFFVPMALQAYGALPVLDRDAHYHLGLIYGMAGDRGNVEKHIAALRQSVPNHLLASMLDHDIAEQAGDKFAISRHIADFNAAYDAEMAIGRPEYEGHGGSIERFRAATKNWVTQ